MQDTPSSEEIQVAIDAAETAATEAERTRAEHRGKRRPSRRQALLQTLAICDDRARTLRRYIGMIFAHDLEDFEPAMRRARAGIERERKKLKKML